MRRTALTLAVLSLSLAAFAGELPVNTWVTLSEKGPIVQHARLIRLPGPEQALVWPDHNCQVKGGSREKTARLHLFDPVRRKWGEEASSFPEGGVPTPDLVGNSYVYLPGIKRVLLLNPEYVYSKLKFNSWLLDPANRKWEGLCPKLQMSDRSADFNPGPRMDGFTVPQWGTLCYDAHNREALLVGGGGVWGRVAMAKEKVNPGDWIYDEAARPARTRRLLAAEKNKIAEARRFFPGHCGSWTFSEETRTWKALAQPLSNQPSGRALPGAAYDAVNRKVVMFGGDDLARCLGDTWLYDCATRKWAKVTPKGQPAARAGQAMAYVPHARVTLMAGGYGTGWKPLADTWVYDTAKNEWSQLDVALPCPAFYCSADYFPEGRQVLLRLNPLKRGQPKTLITCALRLEMGSAPRAAGGPAAELKCHCLGQDWRQPSPEEYDSPANRGSDPKRVGAELAALPANTWVTRKPPLTTASRTWGSYAYDARTHKAYAWGGGHGGYPGADVSEYDVLRNRWTSMVDPPDFKHPWRHMNSGDRPPGLTYQGCGLIQIHGQKTYKVDPLSDCVINLYGQTYDIPERRFTGSIGPCPGNWRKTNYFPSYVTTTHGLYAFSSNQEGHLYRANVAAGNWELAAKGGCRKHHDFNPTAHDSKRDRLLYVDYIKGALWAFDFKSGKWSEEQTKGKIPAGAGGDPAYIPELDAFLFVSAPGGIAGKGPLSMYFYKPAEKKWYTAAYQGLQTGPDGGAKLCNSTFYDPKLKICLRICGHRRPLQVLVMRLEPGQFALNACK